MMQAKNLFSEKERETWLESEYPLTVISDRYGGTYSGGAYLAFPMYFWQIPGGVEESDVECAIFWSEYQGYCGLGDDAQSAVEDLKKDLKENRHYYEKCSRF